VLAIESVQSRDRSRGLEPLPRQVGKMAFLFKSKRSPAEAVQKLQAGFDELEAGNEKGIEHTARQLAVMKQMIVGDGEHEPKKDEICNLCTLICKNSRVLESIVLEFESLEFEAKKDAVLVFNTCMRAEVERVDIGLEYMRKHFHVIEHMILNYNNSEVALGFGSMIRESCRFQYTNKRLLHSPAFDLLFDHIEAPLFDVSSDAFQTFKELLTRNRIVVADFLKTQYITFFTKYKRLLLSENYVPRRQSLKLLGELLLDSKNMDVMMRYISDTENLKLIMNLLRDPSKAIQFEAFHVFKVFVANPEKPREIEDILRSNKEKLIDFLSNFLVEKDDQQFIEEKGLVKEEISKL